MGVYPCAESSGQFQLAVLVLPPSSCYAAALDPSDDEISSLEGGGCFAFSFATGQKGGSEMVWSNWQSNTPFDEVELLGARELARTGAKQVWMCMKESIGWMGKGKSVAVLEKRSKQEIEEYDSEDESDDDDMEI